jgi:excisionase family DNA binding protein
MSKKPARSRVALSVQETADALGIGLNSAYAGIKSGAIPSLRIGNRIIVPLEALTRKLQGAA